MSDTIRDKASHIIEDIRDQAQKLAEMLRQSSGGKKLAPQAIPVRTND